MEKNTIYTCMDIIIKCLEYNVYFLGFRDDYFSKRIIKCRPEIKDKKLFG